MHVIINEAPELKLIFYNQISLTEPWKHLQMKEIMKLFCVVRFWSSNTETDHYWFSVCWLCVVLLYHEASVRTLNICWWSCSILRGTQSLKYEFDCLTLYSLKWVSRVGLMERWGLFIFISSHWDSQQSNWPLNVWINCWLCDETQWMIHSDVCPSVSLSLTADELNPFMLKLCVKIRWENQISQTISYWWDSVMSVLSPL